MRLTPASIACPTSWSLSCSDRLPMMFERGSSLTPKVMAPRLMCETNTPVLPSCVYFMVIAFPRAEARSVDSGDAGAPRRFDCRHANPHLDGGLPAHMPSLTR